jgi:hypothetical protein
MGMRIGCIGLTILIAANSHAADAPLTVCNNMPVELSSITLANDSTRFAVPSVLKPGDCAPLDGITTGSYRLQFNESDQVHAALCQNQVTIKLGDRLVISPDDGAKCLM